MAKPPTIKDVAARAGVAPMTVSKVLRGTGSISPATAERVRRAALETGYTPHAWARGLITGRTRLLALVTTGFHDDFSYEVFHGLQEYARARGYTVMAGVTEGDRELEEETLARFRELRVEGLACMAQRFDGGPGPYHRLLDEGMPLVFYTRYIPDLPCDRAITDDEQGGYLAARHLLALGHRRIGFLAAPALLGANDHREKLAGYRRALGEYRVAFDERLVVPFSSKDPNPSVLRLLEGEGRPTAFVCITDFKCLQFHGLLRDKGLRVPEDISLVGYDDIQASSLAWPGLTTVAVAKRDLGRAAGEMLIARIEGTAPAEPQERRFPPRLVVRGSTAAPSDSTHPRLRPPPLQA